MTEVKHQSLGEHADFVTYQPHDFSHLTISPYIKTETILPALPVWQVGARIKWDNCKHRLLLSSYREKHLNCHRLFLILITRRNTSVWSSLSHFLEFRPRRIESEISSIFTYSLTGRKKRISWKVRSMCHIYELDLFSKENSVLLSVKLVKSIIIPSTAKTFLSSFHRTVESHKQPKEIKNKGQTKTCLPYLDGLKQVFWFPFCSPG